MDTNGTQPLTGQIMPNGFDPNQLPQRPRRPLNGIEWVIIVLGIALGAVYGLFGMAAATIITLLYIQTFRQRPRM